MRTIVLIIVLSSLISSLFMILQWHHFHKRYKGTLYWVFSMSFQFLGYLLIGLRGNIPEWISINLANTLSFAGMILGLKGLEAFLGLKRSNLPDYFLLIIFTLIHAWFTFITPDISARYLNTAVATLLVFGQCSWLMLFGVKMNMRPLTRLVGLVFLGFSIVSFVRIVKFFFLRDYNNDFFQADKFELVVMILYLALIILITYSLTLMFSRRLMQDISVEEEKFSTAFRTSPYALTLSRMTDGFIFEVNDGFSQIFGYNSEEAKGTSSGKLGLWLSESDREIAMCDIENGIPVYNREFKFRKKDGTEITGLFTARIISINKEKFLLSTINDVTGQKKAEQDLREALEHLKHHESNSPLAVIEFDNQFRLIKWSGNAARIFGWEEEEVLGKTIGDIKWVHEDDIDRVSELSRDMLASLNKSNKHVNKNYRKDGSVITCEWYNSALSDRDGNLISVQSLVNDITGLKQNEQVITKLNEELEQRVIERTEMLMVSQKNYKEIFELSPVSIMKQDWSYVVERIRDLTEVKGITDLERYLDENPEFEEDSKANIKVLDVNPATVSLLGADNRQQLLGPLNSLFPGRIGKPGLRDEIIALASGTEVFESDKVLTKLNGELIDVESRLVFPAQGSLSGIVLVSMTDISMRKKTLRELEDSQKMLLASNKELEAFSYTVSHDLRAPLRAIDGFSMILKEDYGNIIDDEGKRLIGVIRKNTGRMGNLIDDLLSFSRLGRSPMNISSVSMKNIIEAVYNEVVTPDLIEKITFRIDTIVDSKCDHVMIRQVWSNLISNAVKFSAGNEKIFITIKSRRERGVVIYSISDNGAGFDMKYYEKLFGVFERLHNVNEFEGTGVGLAIVARIVQRHGGQVWAEGVPGKGSVFSFSLPA